MTSKASFTQAQVRRSLEAARKAGLQVAAITADGTVLIAGENIPLWASPDTEQTRRAAEAARWGDER